MDVLGEETDGHGQVREGQALANVVDKIGKGAVS